MSNSRWQRVFRSVKQIVTPLWLMGFIFFSISVIVEPHAEHASVIQRMIGETCSHLSIALIVGALLVSVDKAIFFDELKHEIVRLLSLRNEVVDSGLLKVIAQGDRRFNGYEEIIRESHALTVVLNYGKDFLADWRDCLVRRFGQTGTETNWFLIDPSSPFIAVLAAKQGGTVDEIVRKIRETEEDLRNCYHKSTRGGVLRIYYIPGPLFPTVTICLDHRRNGKSAVVVTFYTATNHKGSVPLLHFEDHSPHPNVFTFFRDDVARLREVAALAWSSSDEVPVKLDGANAKN